MISTPSLPLMIGLVVLCSTKVLHSPANAQCDPQEVVKLLAADGARGDWFGSSVSISGGAVIAGAPGHSDPVRVSGAAYVYEQIGGVWTRVAQLGSDEGITADFGISVSINGNAAIVGAYLDSDRGVSAGAAYVFERIDGDWVQVAKLHASDGVTNDYFGAAVSISDDTAVVGAWGDDDLGSHCGSAYVFEKVGGVWMQVAKLGADDGAMNDYFGWSVSVSGDTAIVGALADDDVGSNSGSAYVFEKAGGAWAEVAKLVAADGADGAFFGNAVSIGDDVAIVGAQGDDDLGNDSGSAYVFERVGGTWVQVNKLLASDGAADDSFGTSVAIDGDKAIVGAPGDDPSGDSSGSAYLFARVGGHWMQVSKLLASDGAANDSFGCCVSLSDATVAAGAFGDGDSGYQSGSAYLFDAACDGPQLDVNASCPGGGPLQVSWDGATGGGEIALVFARNQGSFIIPNNVSCAGTQLGLGSSQIQVAYRGSAGVDGSRTFNANAGPAACGGYLQLLDLSTCGTSNVAAIQ